MSEHTPLEPVTISQAFKRAIEKFPVATIEDVKLIVPENNAKWREVIHQRNAQQKKRIKKMRKQLNVSVELMEVAGVSVRKLTPEVLCPRYENHIYLDIHGGAYVFFGGLPSIEEGLLIASRLGIVVYSIDYSMPPNSPAPAAVNDIEAVYMSFSQQLGSHHIFLGGTSAGAGLAVALTQQLINNGISLPASLYAGTPWVDLTFAGDSRRVNEGADRVLVTFDGLLASAAKLYAGSASLSDPNISPINGRFSLFPPTFIVAGTRDLFLSDAVRLNRKIRSCKGDTQLEVIEGMSHAEYLIAYETPESYAVYDELNAFFKRRL